jgi:hypothetical protein
LLSNTHCGIPNALFTVEVARRLRSECGSGRVVGGCCPMRYATAKPTSR